MDDRRIQEVFAFIEDANVDLAYDPILKGPKFLNQMVAKCRNLTNHVQRFEREVAQELLMYERNLNNLEAEYEIKYNDLMANNPEVARQPSAKDREARVNDMLKDLRQDIQSSKARIVDMGHVGTVVKSKLRELKDINRDIRLQIKLIEDEIQIGNAWGDQSPYSSHKITSEDIDLDELFPAPDKPPENNEEYEMLFGENHDEGGDDNSGGEQAGGEASDDYAAILEEVEAGQEYLPQGDDSIDYDDLLRDI